MNSKKEIYENAPLAETVFEIRFPGEPVVECGRDKFYEQIRDAYSKVLVPRSVEGKAMAFEPYKFEREDGTYGAMLSINKFAIYCKKYEGFDLFKKETMRMVDIFRKLYKVKKLTRTGLRYINIIPFTREGEIIPLQNYLNIKVGLPESISTDFANLNLIFVSKTDGGSITTRIEPAISQDRSHEVIILDFDYAKEKDLSFDSISQYLNESHQHAKYLFEKLITDGYKKVMKGEVV
ncbi:MAG: TIGR04255 family protein [Actinobacteria bacterium]|nr:TIGR04255 family protein [Chloroflexota bacterium]MBE3128864.1 TIGR04255 family protein [Actinomycetota bacterium]